VALSASEVRAAWRAMLDSDPGLGNSFTKVDLAAAVTAADDWATANAASYNAALSQPFRGTATPQQKALLLAYVAMKRTGVL
jgi:hypothetical protein